MEANGGLGGKWLQSFLTSALFFIFFTEGSGHDLPGGFAHIVTEWRLGGYTPWRRKNIRSCCRESKHAPLVVHPTT